MELKEKLKQIQKECEIKIKREFGILFLLETGFEIGQKTMCKFTIRNSFGILEHNHLFLGEIKKDDFDCLFVESVEEYDYYYYVNPDKKSKNYHAKKGYYSSKKQKLITDVMNIPL